MSLSSPTPKVILLRGDVGDRADEAFAGNGLIKPGMLIQKTIVGTPPYGTVVPHSTAGGFAEKHVAMELGGWGADMPFTTFKAGGIDDLFASGDWVPYHKCRSDDELYMFLKASGAAVVLTDFLESAGDGTLQKATTTNARLFKPLEAVTPGVANTRIRVRSL